MKRLLNEEFLYNGDLYFIKSIVETFQPYICDSCPFNKPAARLIGCISTEIIKCYGHYEIVKND